MQHIFYIRALCLALILASQFTIAHFDFMASPAVLIVCIIVGGLSAFNYWRVGDL